MVLIQLLLPTRVDHGGRAASELLRETHEELLKHFGGITAYVQSPASGVWTSPDGRLEQDRVVMVEVLTERFDTAWWRTYAGVLRERFAQESIHVRATDVQVLDA